MEFSTQGYWFAVNPLWANVFWKIGFGKPLLTAAALGTATTSAVRDLHRHGARRGADHPSDLPGAQVGAVQDRGDEAEGEGGLEPWYSNVAVLDTHEHTRTPVLHPARLAGEQPRNSTEMYTPWNLRIR